MRSSSRDTQSMDHDRLPSESAVRTSLLDSLCYEDDQWLWEPVWQLNDSNPDVAIALKTEFVKRVVRGLLDDKSVELWASPGWPDNADRRLDERGEMDVWADANAWQDPDHATVLIQIRLRQ